MRYFLLSIGTLVAASGCSESTTPVRATSDTAVEVRSNKPVTADNTAMNERDRDTHTKTPMDQSNDQSALDVTAKIRKQILAKKLSMNADNVKIVTADGRVTLRGPVANDSEIREIEAIAEDVAGSGNVDNQLEVESK